MEELIELLINAIGRWLANPQKPSAPSRKSTPRLQSAPPSRAPEAARKVLTNRAVVTAKMPGAARRKAVRRPQLPNVAIAKPILTGGRANAGLQASTAAPAPAAAPQATHVKPISSPASVAPTSAAAIRKWLNPKTLKAQFILTEILQPPLALRPPAEPQNSGMG